MSLLFGLIDEDKARWWQNGVTSCRQLDRLSPSVLARFAN
jgi:hypothetical protein